jgi:hypothetical protein
VLAPEGVLGVVLNDAYGVVMVVNALIKEFVCNYLLVLDRKEIDNILILRRSKALAASLATRLTDLIPPIFISKGVRICSDGNFY